MTATKTPGPVKERRREFRRSVVFPLKFVRINTLTFQKNKWDHEVGRVVYFRKESAGGPKWSRGSNFE